MASDSEKKSSAKAGFIGAVSNMSVQYNMQAASVAIAFMKSAYPEPGWVKLTLLGAVFAGALVGMTVMGYLGDLIGRRRAMLLTLALVVGGALASAALSWGSLDGLYAVICIARFIIGMGVGGIYPLAAATTAESKSESSGSKEEDDRALISRVGWAFFWQTPGSMAPYVFGFLLLAFPDSTPDLTSLQFRLVLAMGAVPAAIVWWATYTSAESEAYKKAQQSGGGGDAEANLLENGSEAPSASLMVHEPFSLSAAYEKHRPYLATLVGTGGSWLLFDVAFYGTNVFTPQILNAIFGSQQSMFDVCWQSVVVTAMGLPACIATILLMPKYGGRWLNMVGFALMAASFGAMALLFHAYPSAGDASSGKFVLFALITFAINFGPNVVTYVMPAQLFPTAVRSRYHGLSAASGKVGAVIGSFMYAPIADGPGGLASVMWVQVVLCLIGVGVAAFLLPKQAPKSEGAAAAGAELTKMPPYSSVNLALASSKQEGVQASS